MDYEDMSQEEKDLYDEFCRELVESLNRMTSAINNVNTTIRSSMKSIEDHL